MVNTANRAQFQLRLVSPEDSDPYTACDFVSKEADINCNKGKVRVHLYTRSPDGYEYKFSYTKETIDRLRKQLDEVYQQAKEELLLAEKRLDVATNMEQHLKAIQQELQNIQL